jgi:hypothetical protein
MNYALITIFPGHIIVTLVTQIRLRENPQSGLRRSMRIVASGAFPVIGDGAMTCNTLSFQRDVVMALSAQFELIHYQIGRKVGSVGLMTGHAAFIQSLVDDLEFLSGIPWILEGIVVAFHAQGLIHGHQHPGIGRGVRTVTGSAITDIHRAVNALLSLHNRFVTLVAQFRQRHGTEKGSAAHVGIVANHTVLVIPNGAVDMAKGFAIRGCSRVIVAVQAQIYPFIHEGIISWGGKFVTIRAVLLHRGMDVPLGKSFGKSLSLTDKTYIDPDSINLENVSSRPEPDSLVKGAVGAYTWYDTAAI